MNTLKSILLVIGLIFLTSCATTSKFPISDLAPAAEITVKEKQDNNGNYTFKITAENLASPERIDSSKKNYVVWMVTEENGIKNAGQLINKNAKKVELETTTPFKVKEIFITAEEDGNISEPSKLEITRKKL